MKFNEPKLYKDIYEVFKNEDYMDMLDYSYYDDQASLDLYDVGWLGEDVFFKKLERYVNKLKQLGYSMKVFKFYDEGKGAEARIRFYF